MLCCKLLLLNPDTSSSRRGQYLAAYMYFAPAKTIKVVNERMAFLCSDRTAVLPPPPKTNE